MAGWTERFSRLIHVALLRHDSTPRRYAHRIVFKAEDGKPRRPFRRTLFKKNGLPRPFFDAATRDFLSSPELARWIKTSDTPDAATLQSWERTKHGLPAVGLVLELDSDCLSSLDSIAEAVSGLVGIDVSVLALPVNGHVAAELNKENSPLHGMHILGQESDRLPEVLLIVEAGALPRPHGPRALVEAVCRTSEAVLAYGDEATLLPKIGPTRHWFKPSAHSPILAAQGTLVGGLVALNLSRLDQRDKFLADLLHPGTDRRALLASLATRLAGSAVVPVPSICHFNTRPARPALEPPVPSLPKELPVVSVIIPTRDAWHFLGPCLESLKTTDWPKEKLEIIVVDNGSTEHDCLDGIAKAEAQGEIKAIRYPDEFNYARINNVAVRSARGSLLVFLNNDTCARDARWLKELARFALLPGAGAVGPKLLYADDTVQHAGVVLGIHGGAVHAFVGIPKDDGGYQNLANLTREIGAVTGACLVVRRDAFEDVGGFNETLKVAFNDIILCCDLLASGHQNYYIAQSLFYHYESKTRGRTDTAEKKKREESERARAVSLHPHLFSHDPFYSVNLSNTVLYKVSISRTAQNAKTRTR